MERIPPTPLKLPVILICMALLLGSTSAVADTWPDTSMLHNPGFESQDEYADFLPAGWLPDWWDWAPGTDFVWDDRRSYEGEKSIRISQAQPNHAWWRQAIAVQPDTDYRLSGWIKTDNVAHSPDLVDAGAHLFIYETGARTQGVFGTTEWTYVEVTFNSGDASRVLVGARLGHWSGITTGIAWFDELRLEPSVPPAARVSAVFLPIVSRPGCVSPNPSWRILVLVYTSTDFEFVDASGVPHHFVSSLAQAEVDMAADSATRFAIDDVPALTSCNMQPTVAIRTPDHPLASLTHMGSNVYSPSPFDVASDRDPAFDSVIVIWDNSGTDLLTGEAMHIQGGGFSAYSWPNGTGQMYSSHPINSLSYDERSVLKHEWGHSILFYHEAAGTAPRPTVDNHINDTDNQYVHCPTGQPYVLQVEKDLDPIPNSIYNNLSGFTHDYYSGQAATPDQPTRCLGIAPSAWATGGPVTKSPGDTTGRTWQSPIDDVITTAVPFYANGPVRCPGRTVSSVRER